MWDQHVSMLLQNGINWYPVAVLNQKFKFDVSDSIIYKYLILIYINYKAIY